MISITTITGWCMPWTTGFQVGTTVQWWGQGSRGAPAVDPLPDSCCYTCGPPLLSVQAPDGTRHGTFDSPHHAARAQQSIPRTSRTGKAALWGDALLCSDFNTTPTSNRDKVLSDSCQVTFVWGYRTFFCGFTSTMGEHVYLWPLSLPIHSPIRDAEG